ncbi:MAG: hypothetical protein A2Z16_05330 [Chloroflexi bacterium RBG_16_54_18]|nr:MAG: hypothetical protein A2Z16_05330 [Chloroflexi bacterium RBG_16_54_18]
MPDQVKIPVSNKKTAELYNHLVLLYGTSAGRGALHELKSVLERLPTEIPPLPHPLDQREAILITYGDQVRMEGENPLATLAKFAEEWLSEIVSTIHILPFYPYSSDDGFSVIDYTRVDPQLGTWEDISAIGQKFRLMFDLVINHVSSSSPWFRAFLQGDEKYTDYFIVVEGQPDLSAVTRPRALPLLTTFKTQAGEKQVWTTFSEDQIDLNFSNPGVLLEMLRVLRQYIERGAEFIRLDAIAYLWKEIGTSCVHLPQTHWIVQLLRSFLNIYAPHARLITETNVPHRENLSYFGDGTNEAQLVYNFALPPLVLHAFLSESAHTLSSWVKSLHMPSKQVTLFNFLASHDGIGITPCKGLISESDYQALVESAMIHGGYVSYKNNPDGSSSPYELNINYFDALSNPHSQEPVETAVARFLAAHAIMLCLAGVPGIYFHSLFGSRSWFEGVNHSGRYRTINRQKLSLQQLECELEDTHSIRSRVYSGLARLLRTRRLHPAFAPHGEQQVLDYSDGCFALLRVSEDQGESILCLHNVMAESTHLEIHPKQIWSCSDPDLVDLISGQGFQGVKTLTLTLLPYQVRWIGLANEADY